MPIEFRCVQCGRLLQTPDEAAGKQAKCPECGAISPIPIPEQQLRFGPLPGAGPASPSIATPPNGASSIPSAPPATLRPENPYQSPGACAYDFDYWQQPELRAYATSRLSGPASGLIVVAAIGLALQAFGIVANLAGMAGPAGPQGGEEATIQYFAGAVGIAGGILGMGVSVIILIGALKMKRLESYGWATAASILAMIPCLSPCCILGLPFGIWGLTTLSDPRVRNTFGS